MISSTIKDPFKLSPVFEWNYHCKKQIVINQGGSSCFHSKQLVITKRGSVPISDIVIGDIVKCYNEKTKKKEWKTVKTTFKFDNTKPTIKVKLKNGKEIIATEDHKFFYEGGWCSLKHLVSLLDGNMETNKRI